MRMNRIYRLILGILLAMVAAGALPAGLAMVIDPSGVENGMDVQILSGSPFRSFLIPGMVLFTINGLGSLTGAMLTFFRKDLAGYMGIFFGTALMIWIGFQVCWIGYQSFLQPLFWGIGIAELILGLIILRKTQDVG
jgi:hypothetical protein